MSQRISPRANHPASHGVLALFLLLALGACSGGGDRAPADPVPATPFGLSAAPPPEPDVGSQVPAGPASGAGIWWQYEIDAGLGIYKTTAVCLVAHSAELACLLFDPELGLDVDSPAIAAAMHGTLQRDATQSLVGSGKLYAAPGTVLADGTSTVTEFTITGGQTSDLNRRMNLTIESLGKTRSMSFLFDHYFYYPYYYHPDEPSLHWSHLAYGVYPDFRLLGEPSSLAIDDTGSLFLQTASGCTGNGELILVDPAYNSHLVGATLTGCQALNGTYTGLASLIDYVWVNGTDDLLFALFTDDGFIAGVARK